MSLIFFNNVISIEAPETEMDGIYRVLAISNDASTAALIQIYLSVQPQKTSAKLVPKVDEIKKIPLAVLKAYEQSGAIRQVELCHSPKMHINGDDEAAVSRSLYDRRAEIMAPFLNYENLSWALFCSNGLGHLVKEARSKTGCSRTSVYKYFSLLCIHGFLPSSLYPSFERCGAPGITRPCDGTRLKAGRKTSRQRVGAFEPNPQRGVTSEDRTKIAAYYKARKRPELTDTKIYREVVIKFYVRTYQPLPKGLVPVMPAQGSFPNYRQFRHIVVTEFKRLDRLRMKTTQGHYNRNMRGLKGKSWEGIAGPGHQYAIDSTIADIFLVSSVNRAWVCGRPVVYIVVDVWSTAIVGFYVCWSGPSWDMAKVALFCSSAGSELVSSLWGGDEYLLLDPQPTLPARFISDRGEYLSEGSRKTSHDLQYSFAINPSYRPDLKGLVEVLNRIAKDEQYGFVPGAIDARRREMELKGHGKIEAVLTLREYAHYLTIIFNSFNHSADRSYRLDAEMISAGVTATPAGLWSWGHKVGYGYRKFTDQAKLIRHLLPQENARVSRSGMHFAGLSYESPIIENAGWTAYARNFGSMEIPVHYFPGSTSMIWTPGNAGFNQLNLSPQAKAKPNICFDEWLDAYAVSRLERADREFLRTYESIVAQQKANKIIEIAREATNAAKSVYSGPQPHHSDIRSIEKSILSTTVDTPTSVLDHPAKQGGEAHSKLIRDLFSISNGSGENGD